MFDAGGSSLTYSVVTDELICAADAVWAVTESAEAAEIETLPDVVAEAGHARLHVALRSFCARWDNGLSHLVGDSETMARRLEACEQAYLDNEDKSQGSFQRLMSASDLPPLREVPDPAPTVGPVG